MAAEADAATAAATVGWELELRVRFYIGRDVFQSWHRYSRHVHLCQNPYFVMAVWQRTGTRDSNLSIAHARGAMPQLQRTLNSPPLCGVIGCVPSGRFLFYLQLRDDVHAGRIPVEDDVAINLAAFGAQYKFGNWVSWLSCLLRKAVRMMYAAYACRTRSSVCRSSLCTLA